MVIESTHDIEFASQSRSAVATSVAPRGHAGDLAVRIELRVECPHRAARSLILLVPAHQADQGRAEAQARQRLDTIDDWR